jgi:hypothetical protein
VPSKYDPYAAESATIEQAVPEYSMPRGTYAAPALQDGDAYIDAFGWSPDLRTSASGDTAPSAQRLGVIPRFDDYPDPLKAPQDGYYQRLGADRNLRHGREESVQGTPWDNPSGVNASDRRWAPNPRSTPPPVTRVTQHMAPGTYSFVRPFDQLNRSYGDVVVGSARHLNGWHFSMADHKRTEKITNETVGSMPVRTGRNTYRIEPTPWDLNVVDMPPAGDASGGYPQQVIQSYATQASRSYRLM